MADLAEVRQLAKQASDLHRELATGRPATATDLLGLARTVELLGVALADVIAEAAIRNAGPIR